MVAEQQQKLQIQQLQDAENKKLMSAIQHQVTVYAWTSPDQPACKICLQDFGWPFLTLDRDCLGSLGLLEAGEQGDLQYYNAREEQDWMDIHIGWHQLVGERECILLRDQSVGSCLGLDECLAKLRKHATTSLLPQTPHLHHSLANECSFVQRSTQISGPWFPQSPLPPLSPAGPPSSPCPVVTPPSHLQQDSQAQASHLLNVISPQPPFIPPPPSLFTPSDLSSSSSSTMLQPSNSANIGIHWPGDFYVADIAKCIWDTQSATCRQGQQGVTEQVFHSHFPNVRFVPVTFSNQKALWSSALMKLCQRFEGYGRTRNYCAQSV
ncbi:hypothetical protein BJ165DRAFT_1518749 [Panaeolus papilionaceus]|nr:hypothetical protein BJ165DRAFT_1518749 [Panaeolus papilionaceus]